ncbi:MULTISPECIES: hypothetical protein [unclassified Sphingomonas]|uniref:hypothetical protein n=1 Tax=unclassified Sphingomonas TaxID=196159 RepID=UPI00226A4D95|nr:MULTISPECIES: hypothetical protein [unclassified Sphingomonas]
MPLTPAEASYIFNNNLGLRYGTTTVGAAYGFMDILGDGEDGGDKIPPIREVMSWLTNPNQPRFEPRWHDRLWNSCGLIVALSAAGTVILVSQAAPTAERYRFDNPAARGDTYSFRKCNRLAPDAQIMARIDYGVGDALPEAEHMPMPDDTAAVDLKTVEQLFDAILATLKKLADPPAS